MGEGDAGEGGMYCLIRYNTEDKENTKENFSIFFVVRVLRVLRVLDNGLLIHKHPDEKPTDDFDGGFDEFMQQRIEPANARIEFV